MPTAALRYQSEPVQCISGTNDSVSSARAPHLRSCAHPPPQERHIEPSQRVEVIDSTGAGDAFCAGFLYGAMRGLPLSRCARLGCAAGASAVRVVGSELAPSDWQYFHHRCVTCADYGASFSAYSISLVCWLPDRCTGQCCTGATQRTHMRPTRTGQQPQRNFRDPLPPVARVAPVASAVSHKTCQADPANC